MLSFWLFSCAELFTYYIFYNMAEAKIEPKKLSIEEQEKIEISKFFEEYKVLAKKHGYDIGSKLEINENGIVPRTIIVKLVENKTEKK